MIPGTTYARPTRSARRASWPRLSLAWTRPASDSSRTMSRTPHLGFLRSSDEYKVMALASYGKPRHLDYLRQFVHATGDGGFRSAGVDWNALAPQRSADESWTAEHADLASSLQTVL